ncbi:hypothetical protein CR513_04525, partial [Mucuna pruriens]
MADSVLSSVAEKNTAKEIWDTLIKLYEVKSLHTRIFLKRKLYTLRMSESISVTDHINNLNTLFSQLTMLDFNISLPYPYDQFIISITNNNIIGCLSFDDVVEAILEEESKQKNKEDMLEKFQTSRSFNNDERKINGTWLKSNSRSKKNFKCYNYDKKGHLKKDC